MNAIGNTGTEIIFEDLFVSIKFRDMGCGVSCDGAAQQPACVCECSRWSPAVPGSTPRQSTAARTAVRHLRAKEFSKKAVNRQSPHAIKIFIKYNKEKTQYENKLKKNLK